MARIQGIAGSDAGLVARVAFWLTKRKVGRVVMPVRIHAHHTRLLRAYGAMEMGQEAARTVDPALKTLVSLKVATLVGCPF
jgi:4-carboxymuconolactone decarboxylase